MKAVLKNYQQAPKKVRVVANALRGKTIDNAMRALKGVDKKVAIPMEKLILSALNNGGLKISQGGKVRIGTIMVDQGVVLKRGRPRAMGRITPIRKRSSIITLELNKQ